MEYRGSHTYYSRPLIVRILLYGLLLLLAVGLALLCTRPEPGLRNFLLTAVISTALLLGGLIVTRSVWARDSRERILLHGDCLEHDRQRIPYTALESASLSLILGRTVRANRHYEDVVTIHVFLCCTIRAAGFRDVQAGERLGTFRKDQGDRVDEFRKLYPFPCQDAGDHLPWMLELGSLEFREFLHDLGGRTPIAVPALDEGEWCE